jgi:iron complex outermembrane receptor protein
MYEMSVLLLAALALLAEPDAEQIDAEQKSRLPEIVVIGTSRRMDAVNITPGASAAPTPDSIEILSRMPGASVNRNGPLSGQAQYRGLFGSRISVMVDSMRVTPGGLNWMDSPMHYLPPGLTERVMMTRGIAPVSSGPGIGGLIEAKARKSSFGKDTEFSAQGEASASLMSNDGYSLSLIAAGANDQHRFHLIGSQEEGDNTEFADGEIGATEYDRTTYGTGYGFKWLSGEFSADYSHTDTGLTGTPALPMDISFFDTNRFNLGFKSLWKGIEWSARLFRTKVAHGMNNFILRRPPDFSGLPLPPFQGEDRREAVVDSDAWGFAFKGESNFSGGTLILGLDGNQEEHSGVVLDPDVPPFFVVNFNEASRDYLGVFAEWLGDLSPRWSLELGARFSRVESDAEAVEAQPAQMCDVGIFPPGSPPCALKILRDRFNTAHRDLNDNNLDFVAKLDYLLSNDMVLNMGFARKTRAPSYIERYLGIPLEVNSGLGDLNNYIGNLDLDSEISHQFELGLEWFFPRGYFSPRIYYRQVDGYIQGVASRDPVVIGVSGMANGDPTPMEFTNTDARIYGFDAIFRYDLSEKLMLDATLTYTRGKNTRLDDNLYRIAPLNGRISLSWERKNWTFTVENVVVARQDKISRVIVLDEPRSSNDPTPGYGVLNLYGQREGESGFLVRFGIENVLDKGYINHLAGFNRMINSTVPLGQRLPGSGINFFASVSQAW